MKLPRIVRQIGKRVVKAAPILRRHILASTDYHVLSGADEARNAAPTRPGTWRLHRADGLPQVR